MNCVQEQLKIYSLLKLLKVLTQRQKLIPLLIPISKIYSKPIFVSEIIPVLYLHDLKKNHLLLIG